MTKAAVDQVIKRAIGDAAFRAKLHGDPGGALTGFDLTQDERAAITSGDPKRLTALGVDQRMSKAFEVGGHGGAAVSRTISPEAAGLTTKALIDEASMNASNLRRIEGDLNVGGSAVVEGVDGITTFNAATLRRIEGDLNVGSASQPVDVSGDSNRLDEGSLTSGGSKFETPVDRRADGFLAKELDQGLPTASSADVDAPNTMDADGNTITE